MKRKWMGPVPQHCDICQKPLKGPFIDGRTRMGPWGIMDESCHKQVGSGLGPGRGQKYDLTTLEKIGG